MGNQRLKHAAIVFQGFIFFYLLLFPLTSVASFIEATMGTAVVNDATATYFNPAGLTLLKNPQLIGLGSVAYLNSEFNGQATPTATRITQFGTAKTQTHYYLPSFYFAVPIYNKITTGLAVISNDFSVDAQENSILRYVQSKNHIQDIDLVSGVGIKINEFVALGAALNFSHANFLLEPVSGISSLNIPDSQSRNKTSNTSWGGDAGFLLKPTKSTLIGFNYRSAIEYRMNGTSIFEGNPQIISNDYHFKFWTPARSVVSINQFVTPKLGLIGTLQRIEWSIFKNLNIFGIATPLGILPHATVPYHLHDTWLLTVGGHYRITSKWIIRMAASYNESPSNGNFQISNGDSIIVGGSMAYEINKNITIDGSYSHAFITNKNIHITRGRNLINGINKSFRDAVSLKLTVNIL